MYTSFPDIYFLICPRVKQFLAENHLPLGLRLMVLIKNLGHLAYPKYLLVSEKLVSEKLVYRFRILALCWLACFSNTHFTPPFGS